MTRPRDPRARVAVAIGIGGVVTLGAAAALVVLQGDAHPMQRVGVAIVPSVVGVAALWAARRLWRAAQRKTT